jgi:predicted nucleotidyltransferase
METSSEVISKFWRQKAMSDIAVDLQSDIDKAAEILKSAGCVECYIFGSVSGGNANENSDIDIAVRGLPPNKFFYVYGQLALQICRAVDLVDLDDGTRFSRKLRRREAMTRVF